MKKEKRKIDYTYKKSALKGACLYYSHSIVAGGFELMS